MPQVKLTVDTVTVMDIDISIWSPEPTARITELKLADLRLKTAEQPWAIPVWQAIAAAAAKQQSADITVTTAASATETMWTLQVRTQARTR